MWVFVRERGGGSKCVCVGLGVGGGSEREGERERVSEREGERGSKCVRVCGVMWCGVVSMSAQPNSSLTS